eukprot:scaffold52442_cov298-Isochrysis_galbana.AAC.1
MLLASAMTTQAVVSSVFAYDECTAPASDIFRNGQPDERSADSIISAAVHAHAVTITSDFGDVRVPKTYHQALVSPHADYW